MVTIRSSNQPWFHNDIRKHLRRRRRAYNKAKTSNSQQHWQTYNRIRNQVNSLVKSAKHSYHEKLPANLRDATITSADYWKTLKSFISPNCMHSDLPPFIHDDMVYEDNQDKANLLNSFFQSQTLLVPNGKQSLDISDTPSLILDNFSIARQDILDSIKHLKIGKACGPDRVNSYVLKEISAEIASPLQALFNYSLSSGKVPRQWKIANVCAIFKKGDPQSVSNYRPISLLSIVSKLLERVLHKYNFNFLRSPNFFTPSQSGFIPNDSTVNQLVSLHHTCTFCLALDAGKEVRVL